MPEACECCYYEGAELKEYERDSKRKVWLCKLCASSMAGNMLQYPDVYPSDLQMVAGIVCNIGNHILAVIREKKEQ